jgi:putative sterol carrier protein
MSIDTNVGKVPEIFRHLAEEGQVTALRDRSGVYEFDITEGGGTWFVKLDHGTPKLEDRAEHPDVVISCSPADFVAVTDGSQNVVTAFLQGRVICTGDLAFALDFRRLLPVPA